MLFKKSIKRYFENIYADNKNYYVTGPHRKDYEESLGKNFSPDSYSKGFFSIAIRILKGSSNTTLAGQHFQEVLKVNQLIYQQPEILKQSKADDFYPENLADCLKVDAYSEFFLGKTLDQSKLLQASQYYEQFFNEKLRININGLHLQEFYIWVSAIVTAILAEEIDRAQSLIDNLPKPFKASKVQVLYLSKLIQYNHGALSESESKEFEKDFNRFFDLVRDPRSGSEKKITTELARNFYIEPITGHVEISMLLEKYILNPSRPLNWENVIENCIR